MRIRMILTVLAFALSACANDPVDQRVADPEEMGLAASTAAVNGSGSGIDQSIQQALELEGLNNVTVHLEGQNVVLGGWVYSPDDKVRAHHVVQSVHGVDEVDFLGIRVG